MSAIGGDGNAVDGTPLNKLYVLLIHGTWAGAASWTHNGSPFRTRLDGMLTTLGYKARFETFPWNGNNRWRGRTEVANAVHAHLDEATKERDDGWEFLVIAHSHGGNIATDAVRKRLAEDSTLPIRGVVCLNTPFLTNEVRGSSVYLGVWLSIALGLGLALWNLGKPDDLVTVPAAIARFTLHRVPTINRANACEGLGLVSGILAVLVLLSWRLRRRTRQQPWGPRPNILCLSCPDDEAITLLGLGEGISNLPQLLLHPLALGIAGGLALFNLHRSHPLEWCGENLTCWSGQLACVSIVFIFWVSVALLGGLIGASLVSIMFGLSPIQALESLVCRVLVSYTPLRPAQTSFRAVSALKLRWVNPLQLFHSAIYRSPQTVDDICEWLQKQTADTRDSRGTEMVKEPDVEEQEVQPRAG